VTNCCLLVVGGRHGLAGAPGRSICRAFVGSLISRGLPERKDASQKRASSPASCWARVVRRILPTVVEGISVPKMTTLGAHVRFKPFRAPGQQLRLRQASLPDHENSDLLPLPAVREGNGCSTLHQRMARYDFIDQLRGDVQAAAHYAFAQAPFEEEPDVAAGHDFPAFTRPAGSTARINYLYVGVGDGCPNGLPQAGLKEPVVTGYALGGGELALCAGYVRFSTVGSSR
jgi:hypothetical protein